VIKKEVPVGFFLHLNVSFKTTTALQNLNDFNNGIMFIGQKLNPNLQLQKRRNGNFLWSTRYYYT